ncbi:RDD family protein [Pleionea litopenaei]|uniref:RDD family protein n=1 Tax=Pleionea litopenaei TaxID=3070815 RepID=A0AA51RVW7_9GAMM|nr:RDD family protein [Pleionea sp. HL-JVS1]WMS88423.1 RDD family protein [Pleionea sp. HL-JVS1]
MSQHAETSTITVKPASPWKRLFAWVYDWLPAAGVFVLTFAIGLGVANLVFIDMPAAEVSDLVRDHPLWIAYLILGVTSYYLYCWIKGGQTVGMRTWRIKLVKANGDNLSLTDSLIRAFLSCGGLANFWSLIDDEYRGWHDIAVNAFVVQLPKTAPTKEQQKPLI